MPNRWWSFIAVGLLSVACTASADRFATPPASSVVKAPDPWGGPPQSMQPDVDDARAAAGTGLDVPALLSTLLATIGTPGRYEAPTAGAGYRVGEPHMAVMALGGSIVEQASFSITGSITGGAAGLPLREVTERLRTLAADASLTGLLLRVDGLVISLPDAVELRSAMAAFRASDKALHCHAETASGTAYLVMAACQTIGLAPLGDVMLAGPSVMPVHLKPLMDRVGVVADFLHVGAFKGAAEPLTRDAPSPEMNETMGAILDRRYQTMVDILVSSRGVTAEVARAIIDEAMLPATRALALRVADVVEPFEAFRGRLATDRWVNITVDGSADADGGKPQAGIMKMAAFAGLVPTMPPAQPHVALFYAVGDVVDGGGDGVLGARTEIASHTVIAALRHLADDPSVRAVVLRIDSGGGSALASELIWHEVAALKAKKPVVVSMSDVAASGGYYIAAGATKIFAMDDTLTGSIGVVGGKLAPGGALDKLGVKTYPMGRGKRATMFASLGPWTSDERAAVQQMMAATYDTFVSRVAAGRGKTVDQIKPIAQGRVWVGTEAKRLGLVDEIGGLDAALADAARLGDVDPDAPLEVYPGTATVRDVVSKYAGSNVTMGLTGVVEQALATAAPAAATQALHHWATLLSFERTPVQAVVLLPAFD